MHDQDNTNQNLSMVKYGQKLLRVKPKACQNYGLKHGRHQASSWDCITSARRMNSANNPSDNRSKA